MIELLDFRQEMYVNISVAAFCIISIRIALKDCLIFNALLDEVIEEIQKEKSIHIGIATETEERLFIPVIKNADKKSIIAIHKEMKELMKNARENKLTLKEIQGSTFTISNVGPMGSIGATPI